jgi:hypothetical protein
MSSKTAPLEGIPYPEMNLREWYHTELRDDTTKKIKGFIFSKTYHGFIADIQISERGEGYSVFGRIFGKNGRVYYDNSAPKPAFFIGNNSYNDAFDYAVKHECLEVERAIDAFLVRLPKDN